MNLASVWAQGDTLNRSVALLLLLMSVLTWCLILYKVWLIARARRSVQQGIAAFWQAPDWTQAQQRVRHADRMGLVWPLAAAVQEAPAGTLAASARREVQLTRLLRDALQQASRQLQWGQILLATIGSTAPFVGLLGTVWGIFHALTGLAGSGTIGIDQVAGPVGESLVMTAFGLLVAIPAVIAYNIFGRVLAGVVERLDGFAHDLLAWQTGQVQR